MLTLTQLHAYQMPSESMQSTESIASAVTTATSEYKLKPTEPVLMTCSLCFDGIYNPTDYQLQVLPSPSSLPEVSAASAEPRTGCGRPGAKSPPASQGISPGR